MTTKRCAFLTMDSIEGWSIDADLAIEPLQALGWKVETVPWRTGVPEWNSFEAVYIGTPWDYPEDVVRFMGVLEQIDRSSAVLVNDLQLVRWGIAKTYLRDLEEKGVDIVPSIWLEALSPGRLPVFFANLSTDRLVIKPVVSTNATDTFLVDEKAARDLEPLLMDKFATRACVVQPFIESIQTEGEYSLFYFGDTFSHAIQKIPKSRDFRVQEEHGAAIVAVPADAGLVTCADRILEVVVPQPVYARCDLVRGPDGRPLLMELELIEPSMYLRMHSEAPGRFARVFDAYVAARQPA